MKLRTNMFLEVSNEEISTIEFSKNIILNKLSNITVGDKYLRDSSNIKEFQIHIKNKNLYILVEGETVFIKLITLPVVKKYLINDMIKNELRFYYKDIDHIAFTYKLIKRTKINIEVLVFCLKGSKLDILENNIHNNINLKKVTLIQFCFKNYYSNKIHEKNYILIFYYNFNLYFLICYDDEIVANNIVSSKELVLLKFSEEMVGFLEKYNEYANQCKNIYYSNINELNAYKSENDRLNIYEFNYLGLSNKMLDDFKREELLKYIIIKG
jgi:hypothetical protein